MKGLIFTLLAALLGVIAVTLTIPPLIRVVNAKKLFEPFDHRKIHKTIVPSIGGVSIFIGFTLATFLASDDYNFMEIRYLFPAVVLMFFIGLKDDLMILPPKKKLMVQIAAAAIMAFLGDFRLTGLEGFLGIWSLDYFTGTIISILLIVAFVNAFNFIDGVDGLAASIGIIATSILGVCFIYLQKYSLSVASFAMAGSLLAFAYYNMFGKKYKLFMGDTGSLIVGIFLAGIAIRFIEDAHVSDGRLGMLGHYAPAFLTGLLILPIIDLMRVVFIRIVHKKSPFHPDNNHLHHRLLQIFPSHRKVTLVIAGGNLLVLSFTLLLIYLRLEISNIIWCTLSLGFLLCYLPFKIWQTIREKKMQLPAQTYPD